MKIICSRKDLYEGVQTVGRAVSSRTTLPILGHLLLKTEDDRIRIAGTDFEIGMECIVEAQIETEGAMTVPARTLTDVLSNLPDADIILSVDESHAATLECGSSEFSIVGLPPDEFPILPQVEEEVRLNVEPEALQEGIKKTAFGISTEEARVVLTGMLMEVQDNKLTLVATDTHRLCVYECPVTDSTGSVSAIVPGRAMNELMRILHEGGGPVSIVVSPSQVMFSIGTTTLTSRLIEGQYPNYNKVLPASHTGKLTIPREQFLQSAKRAEIVARDNSHRTILRTEEGRLVITAESGNIGRAREVVEVIKEGDDIRMAFSARYLIDVLSAMDCEAIEMEISGSVSPALLRPTAQSNYRHVLMPMQLD